MPQSRFLNSFTAEASVPEHLLPYVRSVSSLEPQEKKGILVWSSGSSLIIVGHERSGAPFDAGRLDNVIHEFEDLPEIEHMTVLAPTRPDAAPNWAVSTPPDAYWGISLPSPPEQMIHGQKLRNLLRRAGREIHISQEGWHPDHAELTVLFSRTHTLDPATRKLFENIGNYMQSVPEAILFAARDARGTLQGFAIGDYTSLQTVFYLFAFRHPQSPPGTADALLEALAEEGIRRGHTLLNLGLGINGGIAFFKRKWGAEVLQPHMETSWNRKPPQSAGTFISIKKWLGLISS